MIGPNEIPAPADAFKLSKQVEDPDFFKLMTQLPTAKVLESIALLPPYTEQLVKSCFIQIYSYITQRNFVENSPTFFIHVCGTVFYESKTNILIKDKDHAKKAANTYLMVQGCLTELNQKLAFYPLNDIQKETLALLIKILESHLILFELALATISDDKKEHLKEFSGLTFTKEVKTLTPRKKKAIDESHPISVSPQKGTPKKLSEANKDSLEVLVPQAKRPKMRPLLELRQDRKEEQREDEPNAANLKQDAPDINILHDWLQEEPEKVDTALEEYLNDHMDSLLRFSPTSFASTPSEPAEPKRRRQKVKQSPKL